MSDILNSKTPLTWALEYHDLGWCIIAIPYGKKAARIRWKKYQTMRPDEDQLREWFGDGRPLNMAVVLGPVSGDLCCRDFDTGDGYDRWAADYPDLAAKLPTARTPNGYHLYFVGRINGIRHLDDGELRGAGGYCLLPRSRHPDGPCYEWVNPPTKDNFLVVDPEKAGFLPENHDVTEIAESTEEDRGELKRCRGGGADGEQIGNSESIVVAIERTLPTEYGTRHRRVFDLARELRSIPAYTDADPALFREVVRDWHRRALPKVRTQEFEETWIDFLKAWPKIKYKVGEEPMAQIYQRAITVEPPRIALERYPDHNKLITLTALCRELQRAAGEGPFFLSCRTAARLLQTSAMQVSRWFFLLEADQILKVVSKGGTRENPRKATRFRYVGD